MASQQAPQGILGHDVSERILCGLTTEIVVMYAVIHAMGFPVCPCLLFPLSQGKVKSEKKKEKCFPRMSPILCNLTDSIPSLRFAA